MKEDRKPRAILAFQEGVLGKYDMVEVFKCLPEDVIVVRGGSDFSISGAGISALILESSEFPGVTEGMILPHIDIEFRHSEEADSGEMATWSIREAK